MRELHLGGTATASGPAPPTFAPDAPAPRPGPAAPGPVLPEIQALRAAAVLLVVVYHLWPSVLSGGYVGVDVFFAISGFLITGHLLREVDKEGRVSLAGFWARRARRLLPASLTTLFFCGLATIAVVPEVHWQSFLDDIRASATYVQNWHLASTSVDYLRAEDAPSPVQHFWSLSAEEQFYLVWPILILAATVVGRGHRIYRRRRILLILGGVTAVSFIYSVVLTASDPAQAYFITPTRAWEFGAGGLLALVGMTGRGRALPRIALAWAGIAAIAVAALLYTDSTPFPSYTALLPVLGTLAIIQAGAPTGLLSPSAGYRVRSVQFFGDISYSLYLWHWPLLVLAPYVLSHDTTDPIRALVFVLGVGFAWASKVYIEDPVRQNRTLSRARPVLTFALALFITAGVYSIAVTGSDHVEDKLRDAQAKTEETIAERPPCFGAASQDPRVPCRNPALRLTVVPSPLEARNEENPACTRKTKVSSVSICEFGVPPAEAKRTFALIGDSHATHWRAGMEVVAKKEGWHGLSITRTGCPFSRAPYDLPEPTRSRCIQWNREVPRMLAKNPQVDTVVLSNITGGKVEVPAGKTMAEAKLDGYRAAWEALPPNIKHIVVLRDTPKVHTDTLDCVDAATADDKEAGPACSVARSKAIADDPAARAARQIGPPRAQVVDMSNYLCDPKRCDVVIGGVLVYKDVHHLTREYSTTLGPYLDRKISHLADAWG
ncbi:acyltransferase family protein [Paraconexibacter sp. AEG42_29]|uniref:acyltransferase family protein n=1 Tax=Paraconexibacter sp. AEG42_29 TaxID=2997339 RepID=UPI00339D6A26